MSRFLVYALLDPRGNEVRYVGKSSTGLRRPSTHGDTWYLLGEDHKSRWIKSLKRLGLTYKIVVLEYCLSDERALRAECVWIAQGKQAGWRLTNLTAGGEGKAGYGASPETRALLSAASKGRPKSTEHRAAMARARTGWVVSPETRAKQSASAKARAARPAELERLRTLRSGAVNSPAAREKLRIANTGLVHSAERREANRQGHRGLAQSAVTRQKRVEIMRKLWAEKWVSRRRK